MTASGSDEETYGSGASEKKRIPTWLKVGSAVAATLLLGGLAAGWYYRRTVRRLQNAELEAPDSNFGIQRSETDEEL